MPGFFDIIFGSKPVESEEPKPKKVKKVKTKKVEANPLEATVNSLRDEVASLKESMNAVKNQSSAGPLKGDDDDDV